MTDKEIKSEVDSEAEKRRGRQKNPERERQRAADHGREAWVAGDKWITRNQKSKEGERKRGGSPHPTLPPQKPQML